MADRRDFWLAVDIGGTFTDTVLGSRSGTIFDATKTLTTHQNPAESALEGARSLLSKAGIAFAELTGFIHGTTLATNALIERRGAKVAAITTEGFRDILEIGYERRYSQYDINIDKPDLIVPRSRCFTVPGRIAATGEVLAPLDLSMLDVLLEALEREGVEALAICLLHSYANNSHEEQLRAVIAERLPGLAISISSEVSPEAREFERLCTTVANAYVQPLMARYLLDFQAAFAGEGLSCPILLMTSGGGMTTLDTAARFPIRLVESGPAGGAALAVEVAKQLGLERVVSFDMGGTTAKICLIDDFQPQTTRSFETARAARFIKGSGMPLRIPVVDMIEIGAGGGSIARIDGLGRLTVGPESAGSEPGPAAFGRGGQHPTVTDADVLQGYIDEGRFAEGRLRILRDASRVVMEKDIGAPLRLGAEPSAYGVSQIVDDNMASAARVHAVENGKALEERTMIAFGGNGPLHATRVARRSGVDRILIPRDPGVGSAVGFLFAPISFELVRSRYTLLSNFDPVALNTFLTALKAEAAEVVRLGAPGEELIARRSAFMRYRGQGHEIEIVLPDGDLNARSPESLTAAFEAAYRKSFSRVVPDMEIEILNWAVKISTAPRDLAAPVQKAAAKAPSKPRMHPMLCDLTGARVEAIVVNRESLKPNDEIPGPALVVEAQTTTLVSADYRLSVLPDHSLLLTKKASHQETRP